ncbi:hypothetical protein D9757_003399 [Collybiopsis confluens]|uniref:C2 NT-type domain-containing protein n=1 Tax=Collybiopsis confluens TaxID=2823264 RepID=A0A8H5HTH0_9AGAR|nr:hypothetical protein D9757_003399 [Collybiopsis confluens]
MHTPMTPSHSFRGRSRSPVRPDNIKQALSEPSAHGLRAQLQNLLPRHALFHAHVQIHQISSVPLVYGEFAARWKFKNVQSQTGLLKRVKDRRSRKDRDDKAKAKENEVKEPNGLHDGEASDEQNPSVPSVVVSGYTSPASLHPPAPDFSRSTSSAPSFSSGSASLADSSLHPLPSLNLTNYSTPAISQYSNARGMTPFYKLKEHAVVWNHHLDVVIKMDVDRETSELSPNEFKLVVMQRVIPGDPDAPKNPRLGALYLDLREYAGVRTEVTRTYLLRDTKMNATVKLTIYLEHVGGDTNYTAPPLPKGEIFNGLTDLLEDDVYLTRPRALDLWGPYHNQQELEMDLLGGMSIPQLQSAAAGKSRSKSRTRNRSKSRHRSRHTRIPSNTQNSTISVEDAESDAEGPMEAEDESDMEELRYEVPFDVSRLPVAYGPKTTEMLIEAIFNPVRVTDLDSRGNPFTYYVSPEEAEKEDVVRKQRLRQRDKDRTLKGPYLGQQSPSLYSAEETSSNGHASSQDGTADARGRVRGVKGWWSRKKVNSAVPPSASRPGTPVVVR